MSDLLAATGWIGEHPQTGADVAHLLLYPATGIEQDTPAKIATLARLIAADRCCGCRRGHRPAGAAGR